jgi:predicted RNA-binding Zn ribbon-like protein
MGYIGSMDEAPTLPGQGPFELSGGDLALDFVNTWGDRGRPETDGLQTYPQLLAFARQTGLVNTVAGAGLEAKALEDPAAASAAVQAVLELREALYAIFAARAHDQGIPAPDLERLNLALCEALPNLRLEAREGALAWQWRHDGNTLTAPLWPVARAAAELLTAAPAPVRECDGAQCTWLFLDYSRGRSRRWCSMASCGNRAKARRHYHRRSQ